MDLHNFFFLLIFPCIFVIYWAIPSGLNKYRNWGLLLVSYLLYMNWKPAFAIVLIGVTAICYVGGYLLNTHHNDKRKAIATLFACLGLLPLFVFKYYNFLNDSITAGLEKIGLYFALPGLNWAIPIGISFFTFQAVGYVLDVYHKRVPAEKNFLDFALFVSFFPQVTSGPISTSKDLMPQFKTPHTFKHEKVVEGLKMLLWGCMLKVVIADRLGIYVDLVYSTYEHQSSMTLLFAMCCYSLQIYSDFAGYSLMAIGFAKTLGFDLINNFNRPYMASSITEFWRRWHISLTRWLTTHVYIALGGNRCSKARQYTNIFLTFLVSGIWHGANWTFVFWGALHGLFQVLEKSMGIAPKGKHFDKIESLSFLWPLRIIATFMLVSVAWVFFRMPSFHDAWGYLRSLCINGGCSILAPQPDTTILTILAVLLIFIVDYVREFRPQWNIINSQYCIVRWFTYTIMVIWILLAGVFDASNFIYANF